MVNTSIANQAYEIIQRDGVLSEEEKADLKDVVSELMKKSQKQAKMDVSMEDCRLPRYLTNPGQRRSEWDMAGSDGISRVSAVYRGKSLLTNKMRII